jgi:ELWxxDGT repeat protein
MKNVILGITSVLVLLKSIHAQGPQCQPTVFKSIETSQIVHLDGTLLFTEPVSTGGLWRSDGTIAGSSKIINSPGYIEFPTKPCILDGYIYFYTAYPALQLWKTDGSETGTALVKEFADANAIRSLVATNSSVFFLLEESNYVNKLWKSDGTESGTMLVADTDPSNSLSWDPFRLFATSDYVFFHAGTPLTGVEIWKSDGSFTGTAIIKDINPGPFDGTYHILNGTMAELNGKVYFYGGAGNSTGEQGLWETDGTESGTQFVQSLGSFSNAIRHGNAIYFSANDDGAINGNTLFGEEPWKSDGTPDGTFMIKDIRPGNSGSIPSNFSIKGLGSSILFYANDGISGYELWISDGSAAGTNLVKDINSGQANSANNLYASDILDGFIYFLADNSVNGNELWASDGTTAGTILVADIIPGSEGSTPIKFDTFNGNVYFSALPPNAFDNSIYTCGNFLSADDVADNEFKVFPNPSNGTIQLRNLPPDCTIEVVSAVGIVVASQKTKSTENSISLGQCSSGLYTLIVRLDNGGILHQNILIEN